MNSYAEKMVTMLGRIDMGNLGYNSYVAMFLHLINWGCRNKVSDLVKI